MNRKRKLLIYGGASLVLLVVLEIVLRTAWGFGNMPLYAASSEWEYMTMPEQSGKRLGNKFYFNRYGMRSEEVDSTKKHVLGLGDSVINGGVQTDQDSLATSIFSAETGIQMLNVSAGSWGPDNCAAFLRHYGLFDAKGMFLLVSSHDAHDNMDFEPVVGVLESYPDKQYCCPSWRWCADISTLAISASSSSRRRRIWIPTRRCWPRWASIRAERSLTPVSMS